MPKPAAALAVLALAAAALAREAWIRRKIAALTRAPSRLHARANAATPPKGARPRLVMIGDSRIAQWPAWAGCRRWEVVVRGVAGETAAQLRGRIAADAVALEPDIVLIAAGVNDLVAAAAMGRARGRRVAAATAARLCEAAQGARAEDRLVLLATIAPPARPALARLPVWSNRLPALVAELNAGLRRSGAGAGVALFDAAALLGGPGGARLDPAFRADTLHLNAAAYARLSGALDQRIEAWLAERRRG